MLKTNDSILWTNIQLRLAGQDRIGIKEGDGPWRIVWLESLERGAEGEPDDSPTRKTFAAAVRLHDEAARQYSANGTKHDYMPERRYVSYKVREAAEAAEAERKQREAERAIVDRDNRRRAEEEPDSPWVRICSFEVPQGLRWDTPRNNQGQIIEVSYGTFGAYEAGEDSGWMRVADHNLGPKNTRYYKKK